MRFNSSLSVFDFQSSIPLVLKSHLISRDSYIEGHPVQSLLHLFDESYSSEANYSSLDEDRTFEKKIRIGLALFARGTIWKCVSDIDSRTMSKMKNRNEESAIWLETERKYIEQTVVDSGDYLE